MKLYGKLIVWFLIANLVAVFATVLIGLELASRSYTEDAAARDGQAAVRIYESQGAEALRHWLHGRRAEGVFGVLADDEGNPLVPAFLPRGARLAIRREWRHDAEEGPAPPPEPPPPPLLLDALRLLGGGPDTIFDLKHGERIRVATVISESGKRYRWAAAVGHPRGPRAHLHYFALRMFIGLAAIAAVALFAARRITRPITGLQAATHDFAAGRLQTRVPAAIAERGDELGALGQSFNDMAGRLQRLLETQRQLLRDVSHELRSPLARLRIASELASATPEPKHFERIEQEADRLEELIAQVLLLARLDQPLSDATREPVDLSALLRDVCEDARLEAAPRQVQIELRATDGCRVEGRPDLLQSAIENVVRNAVRYAAAGSTIEVELLRTERELTIAVSDRGPGVPADQLEAIFQPFHRVSHARERVNGDSGGGYGLGLAIADRAVRAHGGRIGAANRAGGGLRVEIRLPCA